MPVLRALRFSAFLLFSSFVFTSFTMAQTPADRHDLHGTWRMQSSCLDKTSGEQISVAGFDAAKWHPAEVPGTVVGALVTDKSLPDPNYGMNLKKFPGFVSDTKGLFATRDMPADSPYRCSFWFRTEFSTPGSSAKPAAWLHFLGINYRANVWLNGKKIADRADVAGAYRTFEFRIDQLLKKSGPNALAVEVFAPEKNDLGLTWVDWNPTPPDKDMGIWREVFLSETGDVSLRRPFVAAKLGSDYTSAALTPSAVLTNTTDHPVTAASKWIWRAYDSANRSNSPPRKRKRFVSLPSSFRNSNSRPPLVVAVSNGRALSLHREVQRRFRRQRVR